MRDFVNIKNESNFFQWLKTWTEHWIYWERIEPANECGFPDTTFVVKNRKIEGAIELKYCDEPTPLSKLMRSSQIVSFVDYYNAGGRKRGLIKYVRSEKTLYFYTTLDVVKSLSAEKPCMAIQLGTIPTDKNVVYILDQLARMMK